MAREEAEHFLQILASLRTTARSNLDRLGPLPFDTATASVLNKALIECKALLQIAQDYLSRMALALSFRKLDGSTCELEVRPEVETVAAVKRRLVAQHGLRRYDLDFVPAGCLDTMSNAALLAEYNLADGVQMIVKERQGEFHLTWNGATGLFEDLIGNYKLFAVQAPRASPGGALLCRGQTRDQLLIGPRGSEALRSSQLPRGINVDQTGWSCSFFTYCPRRVDNEGYYCRTLLGAKPDVSHILMNNLAIGTWSAEGGHREIDFDVSSLENGWHHVCVVAFAGTDRRQLFYIDGQLKGELPAVLEPIYKIGNSSDGAQSWACPIQDLQIFLRPLCEQEVLSFVPPEPMLADADAWIPCGNQTVELDD